MGIKKLIDSKNLGTIELSTGIQISGNFEDVISDENKNPVYFKTWGGTALAYKNKELIGHSIAYHSEGFSSVVGKLKGINIAIEDMSPTDLEVYGIYEGKEVNLKFEGNITVTGEIITGKRNLQGKIILISFKNCTVKHKDKVLFHPNWGVFDMAVGKKVVSAYAGVADAENFGLVYEVPKEKTHKIKYSDKDKKLHGLYDEIRKIREKGRVNHIRLEEIFILLKLEFPNDWLLALEITELVYHENSQFKRNLINYLETLAENREIAHLINDGIALLEKDMKKIL